MCNQIKPVTTKSSQSLSSEEADPQKVRSPWLPRSGFCLTPVMSELRGLRKQAARKDPSHWSSRRERVGPRNEDDNQWGKNRLLMLERRAILESAVPTGNCNRCSPSFCRQLCTPQLRVDSPLLPNFAGHTAGTCPAPSLAFMWRAGPHPAHSS